LQEQVFRHGSSNSSTHNFENNIFWLMLLFFVTIKLLSIDKNRFLHRDYIFSHKQFPTTTHSPMKPERIGN